MFVTIQENACKNANNSYFYDLFDCIIFEHIQKYCNSDLKQSLEIK